MSTSSNVERISGELEEWIGRSRDAAAEALSELISIPSVQANPVSVRPGENFPYGQAVQDAFAYMLSLGREAGFRTCDMDHRAGHIEFGEGEETVGVLAHLDVVPAGDGWQFDPFTAGISPEGMIRGRGAQDDKGPLMAVFFAMKGLKEIGFRPARKIRLILGLDEETSGDGLKYYLKRAGMPDLGFTPDSEFPVIHGEKGILEFSLAKKLRRSGRKGLDLRKLSGGDAVNVVPGSARALVNSPQPSRYDAVCEKARRFSEKSGFPLQTRRSGKSLEIRAEGLAAHGSVPEKGRNAISILLAFLGELSFVNEDVNEFIRFYNEYIGFCTDGSGLDCAFRDSRSGALTFNVGMLHYDREAVGVDCDIRYPVTCRGEQIYEAMMPVLDRFGMGLVKREEEPPLWFGPDDPLVESLMEIYREETGDREALPLVSGGGTYARDCPGTVAFGALFPGDEDRMHMRDEQITEERYLQLIRIYGKALIRLAGERQDPRDAQKARDVQNT